MRLYHHPFSANARKVVMTVLHTGLPVELVQVDLSKGEQRSPDFLALNPNGRVPVLETEAGPLFESNAILVALARAAGGTLLGNGPTEELQVLQWLFWESCHFGRANGDLTWERVIKPNFTGQPTDPNLAAQAEERFRVFARTLDQALARAAEKGPYLLGETLTVADLALAAGLGMAGPAQIPVGDFPHVAAWFVRIQALPCWSATQAG